MAKFFVNLLCRIPESVKQRKKENEIENLVVTGKCGGLKMAYIPGKGRGVVATRKFNVGDFLVEYKGELIDLKEAKLREHKYEQDESIGSFMFYGRKNDNSFCIDATQESSNLGRLINHSQSHSNCIPRCHIIRGIPRIILFAKKIILVGDELLYDYGDRRTAAIKNNPWLGTKVDKSTLYGNGSQDEEKEMYKTSVLYRCILVKNYDIIAVL